MQRWQSRLFLVSIVSILTTLLILQSRISPVQAGIAPHTTPPPPSVTPTLVPSTTATTMPAGQLVYLPLVFNNTIRATPTPTAGPTLTTTPATPTPTLAPSSTPTVLASCDITTGFPNLQGRDLAGCLLSRANLSNATLSSANLTGATLSSANLTGATLQDANLTNAIMFSATVTGANLTGANLTGATLTSANLTNAILQQVDLTGADLQSVNLTGANLSDATNGTTATINRVIWQNTICPDGTNSNNDGRTCVGHGF